jgi:hypothetical protein
MLFEELNFDAVSLYETFTPIKKYEKNERLQIS